MFTLYFFENEPNYLLKLLLLKRKYLTVRNLQYEKRKKKVAITDYIKNIGNKLSAFLYIGML